MSGPEWSGAQIFPRVGCQKMDGPKIATGQHYVHASQPADGEAEARSASSARLRTTHGPSMAAPIIDPWLTVHLPNLIHVYIVSRPAAPLEAASYSSTLTWMRRDDMGTVLICQWNALDIR